MKTRDLLRDWSEGHAIGWLDMTSEVTFFGAGRLADALKAEKPGPVRSEDESPGRCQSEVSCSAGCALKPVSWPSTALTTDTSAGSTRVGLRVITLKKSEEFISCF